MSELLRARSARGQTRMLANILDQRELDVDETDEEGRTALHYACLAGKSDTACSSPSLTEIDSLENEN